MRDESLFHEAGPANNAALQEDGLDSEWMGMFHQLVLYHVQNGHCFVSRHDRKHPPLAAWVERQVTLFHKGKLSKNKQQELEALGMAERLEMSGADILLPSDLAVPKLRYFRKLNIKVARLNDDVLECFFAFVESCSE